MSQQTNKHDRDWYTARLLDVLPLLEDEQIEAMYNMAASAVPFPSDRQMVRAEKTQNKIICYSINKDLELDKSIKERYSTESKLIYNTLSELSFSDVYGILTWSQAFPNESLRMSFCSKDRFDGMIEITESRNKTVFGMFVRYCGSYSTVNIKKFGTVEEVCLMLKKL